MQTRVTHLSDSLTNQHSEDDGGCEGTVKSAMVSTEAGVTTQQQCVDSQTMDQPEHTSETVACCQNERHKTDASVEATVSIESDVTTQQQCIDSQTMDQLEHTSETVACHQNERHKTDASVEATVSIESDVTTQQQFIDDERVDQPEHTIETVMCRQNEQHETATDIEALPPCTLELIHDQSLDHSTVETHNFSAPTLPTEYVQSPLSENPPGSEQGLGSNQHPRELQTFVSRTTSSPDIMSLPSSPEVVQIEETKESDSGRSSPYLFVHKHSMTDASKFESAGLLYARATVDRHNRYGYRASSWQVVT